jgi:hypothetical protein
MQLFLVILDYRGVRVLWTSRGFIRQTKPTDKAFRIIHESWWPQERWTEAEQAACISKIQEQGTQFDYVLSHTGPSAGIACIDPFFANEKILAEVALDSTVVFNDKIDSLVTYKKWFFGHWHSDWGYEHYEDSAYVALYKKGIVV